MSVLSMRSKPRASPPAHSQTDLVCSSKDIATTVPATLPTLLKDKRTKSKAHLSPGQSSLMPTLSRLLSKSSDGSSHVGSGCKRANVVPATRMSSEAAIKLSASNSSPSTPSSSSPTTSQPSLTPREGYFPSPPILSRHSSNSTLSSGPSHCEEFECNRTRRTHGSTVHGYPIEQVPYVGSYDAEQLASENSILRLTKTINGGELSFHKFPHHPPRSVLDVGSGCGEWAVAWANKHRAAGSKMVALDIHDLWSDQWEFPDSDSSAYFQGVQGNCFFLHFPDGQFDFIRVADITLAVPMPLWPVLVLELRRVLAPGGTLEVIEDEPLFPYVEPRPPPPQKKRKSAKGCLLDFFDSDSEDEADKGDTPRLRRWRETAEIARAVEQLWLAMLRQRGIPERLSEFLHQLLDDVFGAGHTHKFDTHQLALAPPVLASCTRLSQSSKASRPGSRDGNSSQEAVMPISGKAAKLMGLESQPGDKWDTFSRKAAQLMGVTTFEVPSPYQHTGFVMQTATMVRMPPEELELHATKHMHTVLSCRAALIDFALTLRDDHGQPVLTEEELDSFLWQYECFVRRRFDWPADIPGLEWVADEAELEAAAAAHADEAPKGKSADAKHDSKPEKSKLRDRFTHQGSLRGHRRATSDRSLSSKDSIRSSLDGADFDHNEDKMTHIRRLRVWGAYKVSDSVSDSN